ncbi:hypothetical protein [Aliiroseovarius sp. PrR006]|uniref:hypothetical protein n=1 Tax=Aliiroseovarius sp. PrR006 TaxID=2706883 RepID=UPI0013D2A681|nr:hypothetical protein [Aliiroseovarius sp. PrR006]NDW53602.1 hypothetical protein [Aliiroseovarius sp. PrR006]
MSDPVSNAEIEDVLSSIRRLIAAGDPDQNDDGQTADLTDDKLILTPAFRVFGGGPDEAVKDDAPALSALPPTGRDIPVERLEQSALSAAASPEDEGDADSAENMPPFVLSFDANMAEPGLQSTSDMPIPPADTQVDFEDNWDSDALGETAQVAFLHQRVTSVATHTPLDEVESEAVAEEVAELEVMVEDEAVATDAAAAAIETEEAPVVDAAPEAEVVPEVDAAPEVEDVNALAVDVEPIADENPDVVVVADEPVEADGDDLPEDEVEDQPILAEAKIDDLTDDSVEDTLSTEVLAAAVDDAPVAEIVEDDSDFIDEDHLQEIVSRIVREELKGEIGVKITQAVRRMVRREVTRALSLEKFD